MRVLEVHKNKSLRLDNVLIKNIFDTSVENSENKDKDGKEVQVTNGMQVNARITYDKIAYFDYVMEALGIKS